VKELLQRIAAFLWHVSDAPESSEETRATADELVEEVLNAINSNDEKDDCPQSGRNSTED
jgi:hypothetical protein